jgi:uncharacterized repeat protein (TIGR02543 family)
VDPIPPITITSAVWKADLSMLKVNATTATTNVVLTYGTGTSPFGTMQFELGAWQGSIVLPSMPATVTVWSSVGAQATAVVVDGTSGGTVSGGGGGGGATGGGGGGGGATGGGGGGSTTPSGTFTLTAKAAGKGNITSSPVGINCGSSKGACTFSYTAGTLVTLTSKADAGSVFLGWTGDCASFTNQQTCTVTMDKARSVTATFK